MAFVSRNALNSIWPHHFNEKLNVNSNKKVSNSNNRNFVLECDGLPSRIAANIFPESTVEKMVSIDHVRDFDTPMKDINIELDSENSNMLGKR